MPELPEVEVTRRGLAPHLIGKTVTEVVARVGALRGSLDCLPNIEGLRLVSLERRAKVLIGCLKTIRVRAPGWLLTWA